MNFLELTEQIIKEEKRPLTPNEIWEIAKLRGYDNRVRTSGKTPWQTIGARLYVDIRDNPSSKFMKLNLKPTRFFLKEFANDINNENYTIESPEKTQSVKVKLKERDLHKYLTYFVYNYSFIYTKTIFHETSKKTQYSQWLHPDMVGVYFHIEEWENEVIDISKETGNKGIKLFSYELKRELIYNNLRESYFQAVSNSSWANEGYLVVAEIEYDEEFLQEIKRLTNSFGIGIIKLDVKEPDSSEILFPAKEKDFVDIEIINNLAKVNDGFKEFLQRIKADLTTKEIRKEKYDKIFDIEELIEKNM